MTIGLLVALCVSIASFVFIVAFTIFCYAKNNNTVVDLYEKSNYESFK